MIRRPPASGEQLLGHESTLSSLTFDVADGLLRVRQRGDVDLRSRVLLQEAHTSPLFPD